MKSADYKTQKCGRGKEGKHDYHRFPDREKEKEKKVRKEFFVVCPNSLSFPLSLFPGREKPSPSSYSPLSLSLRFLLIRPRHLANFPSSSSSVPPSSHKSPFLPSSAYFYCYRLFPFPKRKNFDSQICSVRPSPASKRSLSVSRPTRNAHSCVTLGDDDAPRP